MYESRRPSCPLSRPSSGRDRRAAPSPSPSASVRRRNEPPLMYESRRSFCPLSRPSSGRDRRAAPSPSPSASVRRRNEPPLMHESRRSFCPLLRPSSGRDRRAAPSPSPSACVRRRNSLGCGEPDVVSGSWRPVGVRTAQRAVPTAIRAPTGRAVAAAPTHYCLCSPAPAERPKIAQGKRSAALGKSSPNKHPLSSIPNGGEGRGEEALGQPPARPPFIAPHPRII